MTSHGRSIRGRRALLAFGVSCVLVLALGTAGWTAPGASGARCGADLTPGLNERLRERLEAGGALGEIVASGHHVRATTALPSFYGRREDAPAWIARGAPSACAARLIAALRAAPDDGLDSEDYHLDAIDSLMGVAPSDARGLVDLDILLTDAYLTFGSHLLQGRVNPSTLEPEWLANRRQVDMAANLDQALAAGDVSAALEALRPPQPGYQALKKSLARLRDVEARGGWGSVPDGPTLRSGERDARVPALRRRLLASGDLTDGAGVEPLLFDPVLESAVEHFQHRHGLDVDGSVGKATLAALNVPVEARIQTIAVNLERWRWLPNDLGRRHIRVNIADYRAEVWENGAVALDMRAVVGREYRETPVFSASMTYLVFAPYWNVPPQIAALDKLPEIKKNPGYLASMKMTLFRQSTNVPVDPSTVDFSHMSGAEFNRTYRIRQDPGPANALGRVKFIFPNRYQVYLHDTPSRELFSRTARAFSSGCIRLEKPLELADYLLAGDPRWSPERIRAVVSEGRETTVWLSQAVPVHLLYWTAFTEGDGTIDFRRDLYGRDAAVLSALEADPPGP